MENWLDEPVENVREESTGGEHGGEKELGRDKTAVSSVQPLLTRVLLLTLREKADCIQPR